MARRERNPKSRRKETKGKSKPENKETKSRKDPNRTRREQYRSNVEYREKAKQRSRETYRKSNPRKKAVNDIDKPEPKTKEVTTEGIDYPIFTEVLTIPESAKFLGRSALAFKRWISDKLLPPPILQCTSYGYMHYSIGELQLIAKILKEHEKDYEYLHHTHEATINQLWQTLEAYRKSNF